MDQPKDLMELLLAGKRKLTGPGGLAGQGGRQLVIALAVALIRYPQSTVLR